MKKIISKNLNKYSFVSLILAFAVPYGIYSFLDHKYESSFISNIDHFILKLSNWNWSLASWDILYWLSVVSFFVFLILSIILGLKYLRQAPEGSKIGRLLSIITITLSLFSMIVLTLFNLFVV